MTTSIALLISFASISAISRGIISVIDRYQMGYRKQGVIEVNLINNLSSIFLVTIFFVVMMKYHRLPAFSSAYLLKMMAYALVVQLVAYGYSYIYKKINIMQAVIVNKLSDLFIPLALFLTTGYLDSKSYFVSILSTIIIAVYIIYKEKKSALNLNALIKSFLVIVPLLVFQSAISPVLTKGVKNGYDLICFTIFTIYIRGLIALIAFMLKIRHLQSFDLSKNIVLIYACRAVLTLSAQITYTLATSSPNSSISWVFLNITPLYSVILGALFLHEKIDWRDGLVILLIFILALIPK